MIKGLWHQLGYGTENLVLALLQDNVGQGGILSPIDLDFRQSQGTALGFQQAGKGVLWDPQFYDPPLINARSAGYPTHQFRLPVEALSILDLAGQDGLTRALEMVNRSLRSSAVIAPAVIYEAGSPHLWGINQMLFRCAKKAGDHLGIPTLASIPIGSSVSVSEPETLNILGAATALPSDGWYILFEFDRDPVPVSSGRLARCASSCLSLAGTERPILFGFSGLMSLPVMAWGASAVGFGHAATLHQFKGRHFNLRTRLQQAADRRNGKGGGGPESLRFFSSGLWTGLACPDETSPLALLEELFRKVMIPSPYSQTVMDDPSTAEWSLDEAHMHYAWHIHQQVEALLEIPALIDRANQVKTLIDGQIELWGEVQSRGIAIRQGFHLGYWTAWKDAIQNALRDQKADYDWLLG